MIGIYFSGTGNTRYCVETFMRKYKDNAETYSIEDDNIERYILKSHEIVFGYPVQYSQIPKYVKDFIDNHADLWKGKHIFVIATMGLFSGDGAGLLARQLKQYGATIVGGLHLKMPDSIGNEKALKRPLDVNKELVISATHRIEEAVMNLKKGQPSQVGLGFFYHLAGLFGQRLYFYNKTKKYNDKLKIDISKCIGCGKCVELCPMKNIDLKAGVATSHHQCTMCYRCVNNCPTMALTVLGKTVIEQSRIEKYL